LSSYLPVQIIVEVVFFSAVFVLLWRLKRDIEKYRALADGSVMEHLNRIMADSQEFAGGFVTQVEESKLALSRLARQLDEKEKKLALLIDRAEAVMKQLDSGRGASETPLSAKRYDDVIHLVRKGMSREDVAKYSGLTEDEITLILELSGAGMGNPSEV
jgi:CRP-like cAMP-binding protein